MTELGHGKKLYLQKTLRFYLVFVSFLFLEGIFTILQRTTIKKSEHFVILPLHSNFLSLI